MHGKKMLLLRLREKRHFLLFSAAASVWQKERPPLKMRQL